MKNTLALTLVAITLALGAHAGEAAKQPKANCELRLVSNAGAGEAFLSVFAASEEECLAKSDSSVEAKYRNQRGTVVAKRGGAGPQP